MTICLTKPHTRFRRVQIRSLCLVLHTVLRKEGFAYDESMMMRETNVSKSDNFYVDRAAHLTQSPKMIHDKKKRLTRKRRRNPHLPGLNLNRRNDIYPTLYLHGFLVFLFCFAQGGGERLDI